MFFRIPRYSSGPDYRPPPSSRDYGPSRDGPSRGGRDYSGPSRDYGGGRDYGMSDR